MGPRTLPGFRTRLSLPPPIDDITFKHLNPDLAVRSTCLSESRRGLLGTLTSWVVLGSYGAALLVFLASLSLTFRGQIWVVQIGSVTSISLASISVIYALGQYRFMSAGYGGTESIVLGVLFANAFLQCYEIVYRLTWDLSALVSDPPLTGVEVRTFLLWLVMASPIVLVREHLRFKRTSAALLLATAAVWLAWILYGFPQYYLSGYFFPQVLKTSDPYHLSLWLNFGSKALMASLFVSMLEPSKAFSAALSRLVPSRRRPETEEHEKN